VTVCVFTGPTLPASEAEKLLDAVYLPPAAIGDVYKAARQKPWAIGIIDGFFESTPSVWHKEVLWAMSQGIHVFGASSMGALRAAELASFGMIGVGRIFEAYRDGEIEDDDEVAVVHGPPEVGYIQVSEALVNIRATLQKAAAAEVVTPATAGALIDVAKSLFYKQRTYERVLAAGAKLHLPCDQLQRLKAWLPANQVNQKRLDAVAMLETIGRLRGNGAGPKSAAYQFERTILWEAVEREFGDAPAPADGTGSAGEDADVLEALRLDRLLWQQMRPSALLRTLTRQVADERGWQPAIEQLQEATRRFAQGQRLETPTALEAWLAERGLGREQFLRLMEDDARQDMVEQFLGTAADQAMLDELRLRGEYPRLLARARRR
jgi:hypothetical protein